MKPVPTSINTLSPPVISPRTYKELVNGTRTEFDAICAVSEKARSAVRATRGVYSVKIQIGSARIGGIL